mmetsp:Transcript_100588/g.215600  ORF Transcript_100588/g.215600 Transcript_100588/m.215600 type:complete len:235 (-) Transcript_100588:1250-1954(-)
MRLWLVMVPPRYSSRFGCLKRPAMRNSRRAESSQVWRAETTVGPALVRAVDTVLRCMLSASVTIGNSISSTVTSVPFQVPARRTTDSIAFFPKRATQPVSSRRTMISSGGMRRPSSSTSWVSCNRCNFFLRRSTWASASSTCAREASKASSRCIWSSRSFSFACSSRFSASLMPDSALTTWPSSSLSLFSISQSSWNMSSLFSVTLLRVCMWWLVSVSKVLKKRSHTERTTPSG